MSQFLELLSSMIAMLVSAALMHFGAMDTKDTSSNRAPLPEGNRQETAYNHNPAAKKDDAEGQEIKSQEINTKIHHQTSTVVDLNF
jgi:hypothetical protein